MDSQNSQRSMRKMRRRSSNSNRPIADAITTAASALVGRFLIRSGASEQQQRDRHRTDDTGELSPGARGLGDRGARGAAADRKALEESGGQVGGAQADHLLVRVDVAAGLRRIGAGEDTGVGERYQGDGTAADHHRADVGETDPRHGERRQALRQRTEHIHAGAVAEVEYADRDRGCRPPRSGCPGCA